MGGRGSSSGGSLAGFTMTTPDGKSFTNEILKRAKSGSASVKIHTPKELRDMDAKNKRLAEEHANRPDYDLGMTELGIERIRALNAVR